MQAEMNNFSFSTIYRCISRSNLQYCTGSARRAVLLHGKHPSTTQKRCGLREHWARWTRPQFRSETQWERWASNWTKVLIVILNRNAILKHYENDGPVCGPASVLIVFSLRYASLNLIFIFALGLWIDCYFRCLIQIIFFFLFTYSIHVYFFCLFLCPFLFIYFHTSTLLIFLWQQWATIL